MRSETKVSRCDEIILRAPSMPIALGVVVGKAEFEEPPNGPYALATASHFVQGEARSTAMY